MIKNVCFVAARPYVPATEINWVREDMSRTRLSSGYESPAVDTEYRRFLYRDATSFPVALGYCIACYVYPALQLLYIPPALAVLLYLNASLLACFLAADIVLHFGFTVTPRVSRFRQVAAFGMVIGAMVGCWGGIYTSRCDKAYDLMQLFGRPPQLAPWQQERYCVNTVNHHIFSLLMLGVTSIKIPSYVVLLVSVVGVSLYYTLIFGIPTDDGLLMTGEQLFASLVLHIAGIIAPVVVCRGFELSRMKQFEQAIETERLGLVATQQATELDVLLANMVAPQILDDLVAHRPTYRDASSATVLFSDMVSFTRWSSTRTAREVVAMLNVIVPALDIAAMQCDVEKIKTIGDAYWAVSGLPSVCVNHATRIINFGRRMIVVLDQANGRHAEWNSIRVRIGIHSGELSGAVLGTTALSFEVFGATNHIAEEIEKAGLPMRLSCSETTRHLAMDEFDDDASSFATVAGFAVYPARTWERKQTDGGESGKSSLNGSFAQSHVSSTHSDRRLQQQARKNFLQATLKQAQARHAKQHTTSSPGIRYDEEDFEEEDKECGKSNITAGTDEETTREAIVNKYSARKYRWFLLMFANDDAETEYQDWACRGHASSKLLTRLMSILTNVAIVVGSIIAPCPVPVSTIVLWSVAFVLQLVSVVLAHKQLYAQVDDFVLAATFQCVLIGAGLLPDSFVGNDTAYMAISFNFLLSFGTVSLPWLVVAVILMSFMPPVVYFAWFSPYLIGAIVFLLLCVFVQIFLMVMSEIALRCQFLEVQEAQFFANERTKSTAQQRALLETIVPNHIIVDLMRWIQEDELDPAKSIVRELPHVVVGFAKLLPPRSTLSSSTHHGDEWVLDAHVRVDKVLADFPGVSKIKTIGDIVLLCGPLGVDMSLSEAASQLLRAVALIQVEHPIQAGLHAGDAVGAVCGTSRLAFDVFGDCINVASRAMSTGSEGQTSATDAFCELVSAPQDTAAGTICFGDRQQRTMQGKEDVFVRPVIFPLAPLPVSLPGNVPS